MATLIKTLKLRFDGDQLECQANRCEITDEPSTEEVETFCGTETFSTRAYKLNLAGFQDWTVVDGICAKIHGAYLTDPIGEIEYELSLGEPAAAWRSGTCKPTADVPFGGTAGSPLAFEQVLDIVGTPDEVALTP